MAQDGLLLFDTAGVDLTQLGHLQEVRIGGAGQGSASTALSDEAATFFVGTLAFPNQRVTLLTTDAFKGFPTDGVIGYSLLGHYAVEIDYDKNGMTLYEPTTFADEEGWQSLDLYFKDNLTPWIDISLATAEEDPVRLSTYIDFASGEALELLERETNAFSMPRDTRDKYVGRGLSGDVYGKAGRVSKVILGPFTLNDVSVVVVPAQVRSRQNGGDAILGNDVLRRFNVIFDYAHLKLHLKPNHYFAEPFG